MSTEHNDEPAAHRISCGLAFRSRSNNRHLVSVCEQTWNRATCFVANIVAALVLAFVPSDAFLLASNKETLVAPSSGFGARGLYTAPTGIGDDAVKAAYLSEVNSLIFRAKLGLHNVLTPFHNRTSIGAVREAVENGAFGRGPFTVKMLDDGTMLFGGNSTRTFLNRQFFHHELIHVSQMVKNPNLWTEFPLRMLHEPIQIWTAHGTWGIPATILTGWWILESTDGD